MNIRTYAFKRSIAVIPVIVLLFFGCRASTVPVSFYTLSEIPAGATVANFNPAKAGIGVGPVTLPDFLNTPRIVTRTGPHRIHFSEFHRWGGNLERDILRVITQNLSQLLPSHRVMVWPGKGRDVTDYQLSIDIHQFEGDLGGRLILEATWALMKAGREKTVLMRRPAVIEVPVAGADFEALVAAHSAALAEMSRQIAGAVETEL